MAAGAARVPAVVIKVLEAFWARDLMDFFTVIGTHALYAYEAAARVTFDPATTATHDVDLLMDVQQRMKLLPIVERQDISILDVLREADPSFERMEEQKESAMNATGFIVDFLRREEPKPVGDAFSASGKEGDVYPVQAPRSQQFLNSPRFEHIVIGADGRMTVMRTIDPRTFVDFKLWMSDQPTREFIKRARDRQQALAVQSLLDAGRLRSAAA